MKTFQLVTYCLFYYHIKEHRLSQLASIESCESTLSALSMDGLKLQIVKRQQSLLQSRVISLTTEYDEAKASIVEFNVSSLIWKADYPLVLAYPWSIVYLITGFSE